MVKDFVPFITEHYDIYGVLVNIYQLLFMYCFGTIILKVITLLNKRK